MKNCPTCNRTFEDTFTFCLADGSLLNAPVDPHATLIIPEARQTQPPPTVLLDSYSQQQSATGHQGTMRRPNRMRWIVAAVAVAIIGTVLAVFLLNRNSSGSVSAPALSPDEAFNQGIAAHVNGKPITLKQIDKTIGQQSQDGANQLSPAELATARLKVLDNLINEEVLFQRAERERLLPTDDEVTQLLSNKKTAAGMTEDEFQRTLKERGETSDSLREVARRQLAIQKLLEKETGKITVNDSEVVDYYNNNKQNFVNKRGVGLAGIVVDPADNGAQDDARSESEAKAKIDSIYAQLKNGADFATVARARSEDQSNVRGGDFGVATEDELNQNGFPRPLIEQFFGAMPVGSYTAPVQFSTRRWYIFKLQSKQLQDENLTLDSPGVRQQIMELLVNQKKQVINEGLQQTAKNEAQIVNYLALKLKTQ